MAYMSDDESHWMLPMWYQATTFERIRNDYVYYTGTYTSGDPSDNRNEYPNYAIETNNWATNRPFWFIWACDSQGNDNNIVTRAHYENSYGGRRMVDGEVWDREWNQEYDEEMIFAFSAYVTFQQPTQAMVNNYRQWEQRVIQTGNCPAGFMDGLDFEWVIPYRNVPWRQEPSTTADLAGQMGNMQIDGDDDDIQMGPDHPDYNRVNDRLILRF